MTDTEKQALLGSLLERHKTAKQHLACLDAKATGMARNIKGVTELLTGNMAGEHKGGGQFVPVLNPDGLVREPQPPVEWPTAETIAEMMEARQKTKDEIALVEKQIQDMGYSNYIG